MICPKCYKRYRKADTYVRYHNFKCCTICVDSNGKSIRLREEKELMPLDIDKSKMQSGGN